MQHVPRVRRFPQREKRQGSYSFEWRQSDVFYLKVFKSIESEVYKERGQVHGVISLQPLPLYNQDLFQKDKWRQNVWL